MIYIQLITFLLWILAAECSRSYKAGRISYSFFPIVGVIAFYYWIKGDLYFNGHDWNMR